MDAAQTACILFAERLDGSNMVSERSIADDTVVARTEGLISAQVGEEVVMLHLERNAYYDVDAIGAAIWQRLEAPTTVGGLVDWLVGKYEVDRAICSRDVGAFLSEALAEGVVQIIDAR